MGEEVELCVEIGSNMNEPWVEKANINELCRACANTHANMIPIFEGDGLEHDLKAKIDKHFPVTISKNDGLPHRMCFQCASTLVAWHDMFTGCIDAEKKLKNLLKISKEDSKVVEEALESSVSAHGDLATEKLKLEQNISVEMDVEDGDDDDDDDDDDHHDDDEEEDAEEDEIESEEVVLHKLDGKKKENAVEIGDKETTIRDQCLNASSTSVSHMNPERITCSDKKSECVKRCMKKYLRIKFACDVCGKQFLRQVCLLFHIKKMHENANLYKCRECNAAFKCVLKYKIHVEQNHPDCTVDGNDDSGLIQTGSQQEITQRQLQESSKFLASLCEDPDASMISDNDSNNSIDNSYSNSGELNFENFVNCDEGNTANEENSSRIGREYTSEAGLTCSLCSQTFASTLTLIRHWKFDHTIEEAKSDPNYTKFSDMYTCNICQQFYTNTKSLKDHRKNLHGIEFERKEITQDEKEQLRQVEIVLPDGSKVYRCPFCLMVISSDRRYLTHANTHSGNLRFCCELCGKQFSQNTRLKNHIKVVHEGVRAHKCEFCGKEFGDRSNMIQHTKTHSSERPYSCEICGMSYTNRNSLYAHRRGHSNFLLHKCSECDASFARRPELTDHFNRKHSTEKQFICAVCGKRFAVKASLRNHMVTHSDDRPHACTICERSFKRRKYLKTHMNTHHSLQHEIFTAILQ